MKTEKVVVAGTLIIPGIDDAYFLLNAEPTLDVPGMPIDTVSFLVANSGRLAHHIVIRGPFVVDYWSAGRWIEIQIEEEAAQQTNIYSEPEWLETLLKGEPASLAED